MCVCEGVEGGGVMGKELTAVVQLLVFIYTGIQ